MARAATAAIVGCLTLATGCFHTGATVNLRDLQGPPGLSNKRDAVTTDVPALLAQRSG